MDAPPVGARPAPDYRISCRITDDGRFVVESVDTSFAARLGYSVADLTGPQTWLKLSPPEDIGGLVQSFNAVAGGKVMDLRVRTLSSAGEVVTLEIHVVPEPLGNGEVAVEVEARDVTEIARLERALLEAEGRLRLLDRELSIGMWTTDDALRFTWSSGTILGEENSLVGTSLYEFFEDDIGATPIQAYEAALRGETASYEVEWGDFDLRVMLEPLRDELGRIVGVMAVAVDLRLLMRVARLARPADVVRARHERVHPPLHIAEPGKISLRPGLEIDPERFELKKDGKSIALTVTEFKLLLEFAGSSGAVLSRKALAERVWGHPFYGSDASLTMAISRLRDKIEEDPANPNIIQTVRGVGYRLGL